MEVDARTTRFKTPDMTAISRTHIIFLFAGFIFLQNTPASHSAELRLPTDAEVDANPALTDAQKMQAKEAYNKTRRKCSAEWPDDFAMQAACIQRQIQGVLELARDHPTDITEDEQAVIAAKCFQEWPDDHAMNAACRRRQYDGVRQLR